MRSCVVLPFLGYSGKPLVAAFSDFGRPRLLPCCVFAIQFDVACRGGAFASVLGASSQRGAAGHRLPRAFSDVGRRRLLQRCAFALQFGGASRGALGSA